MSRHTARCALCGAVTELCESHTIPKCVYARIRANSPTGFLRRTSDIDRRVQDPDKQQLLCRPCEDRFQVAETEFARTVLDPFMADEVPPLTYEGSWLYYFITSVTWRALVVDLPGLRPKWPGEPTQVLETAESTMRRYLLGLVQDIEPIQNMMFFADRASDVSEDLVHCRPNMMVRCSAFSYAFFIPDANAYYVYANLAGIVVCSVVRRHTDDAWVNTQVFPSGGTLCPPQRLSGPLGFEFLSTIKSEASASMSGRQEDKIRAHLQRAGEAVRGSKAAQFRLEDLRLARDREEARPAQKGGSDSEEDAQP